MEKIESAKIIKDLIEKKEFFIYPHREVKDLFDIVLYKQIWFKSFYISFYDFAFLYSSLDYQKSIIYNLYKEVKMKNRYKKAYFYFVISVKNIRDTSYKHQLEELISWIKEEKINGNLLVMDVSTMDTLWNDSSFEDQESLVDYFSSQRPYMSGELEEINLLEVEKNTRINKGYYLPRKTAYFTKLFMIINILYFAYMTLQGGTTDIYNLIKFGAKYNPLIANGEYYRLFTNMFIHIGIVHLLLNTYALNILGKDAEAIYGHYKYLIIYIVSGVFGGLGSFIFSDAVSAGASGAIFGLMGSYIYFGIKKPLIFSARYGMNLITLLIINIIFGLSSGSIDNFAHLGGLLGGFISSWALGLKEEKFYRAKGLITQFIIIISIVALLFVGVQKNQNSWEYHFYRGIKYLQEEDLKSAKSQFEIGIEKNKTVSELYFYMALIHYYEGDHQKTRDYLNKTLSLDPNDNMAKDLLDEITSQ